MNQSSEKQLMNKVKKGCERSFTALYKRYKNPLQYFIYCRTGDRDACEDLLQETFLRIWKYRHTWQAREDVTVKTWIYTIALNLIFDEWTESRKFFYIYIDDDTGDRPPVSLPDYRWSPDGPIINDDLSAALNRQIQNLPKHYREPFILREFYLISYQDIARILVIKHGTVKSRINRAREILQYKLRHYA